MLFYLQSTNPKEYGTLKLQTNLGLQNEGLAFRVLDFNTIASFVITDETDFIEIEIDGTKSTYHFPKKSTYKLEKLAENITSVISNILTVEFTDMKTLKFSNEKEFKILNMSHRVQLLLGAYHMQLPLESNGNIIKMKIFPYTCYGNSLFIESKISNISGVSNKNSIEFKSFCYAINSMFIPNVPIIAFHPGKWVNIAPHNLKDMEFRLVDFQGEPIKLNAPVKMTVEVEFLSNLKNKNSSKD